MLSLFKSITSSQIKKSNGANVYQLYLAKEIDSETWIDSKVKYGISTDCLHLTADGIIYHTKDKEPVKLVDSNLSHLFFSIGKGWSRLATKPELAYIKAAIEYHATKSESTRRYSF